MPKLLVVGATGVTGSAIVRRFAAAPDWEVVSVARRAPWYTAPGVRHVRLDLTDAAACRAAAATLRDVTHIVYTAVEENAADIVAGWDDPAQSEKNGAMLRNLLEPFIDGGASAFAHITLIHGMKAYGSHLPNITTHLPFKESDETYAQLNFYHLQQAYVTARAEGADWGWTVLRPNGTIGVAVGGNMNWSLALAVFAALCAHAGEPMPVPAGDSALTEITDCDLVAHACEWAALAPVARNQVYNITNGDVIALHDVFPILAELFDLPTTPPHAFDVAGELARLAPLWPALVERHGLAAPADLATLLGATTQIFGVWSAALPPERKLLSGLSSTIKLRQAGFGACADSADTVRKIVGRYRDLRLLP